jgi:hypothetical protein
MTTWLTAKRHKFGAQRTIIDGIAFSSKLEGAVYSLLKLREKAKELTDIQLQASVRLKEKCNACGAGAVVYKVDFSFTDLKTGATVYCEAKGVRDSSYVKRERIWRKTGPGILEVWGGNWKSPRLTETIFPEGMK